MEKVIKETIVVEKRSGREPVTGPIEIVGWSVNGMNPDAPEWNDYRETVLAIMDEMPGVTFTWRDMGLGLGTARSLVTGLLGGTAPDIIVNESFIQPYARMGAYLPLDDALEEAGILDNLIPGTYANAVADGKIYGISQFTGVFAFESNAAVVERAGLDPTVWPTTWDELLERCAAITEAGKDEFYGYTLQGPVGFLVGGIMRYNVFGSMVGAPMCKNDCMDPFFDDPKLGRPWLYSGAEPLHAARVDLEPRRGPGVLPVARRRQRLSDRCQLAHAVGGAVRGGGRDPVWASPPARRRHQHLAHRGQRDCPGPVRHQVSVPVH